jgi:hypothetical protein
MIDVKLFFFTRYNFVGNLKVTMIDVMIMNSEMKKDGLVEVFYKNGFTHKPKLLVTSIRFEKLSSKRHWFICKTNRVILIGY